MTAGPSASAPSAAPRPEPGRRLAFIASLVLLGLACWFGRWATASSHASGDTFWYSRMALEFAGHARTDATEQAARFIVEQGRGQSVEPWLRLAATIDPRYPAIFESRPLYPMVAAAFLPVLGLGAMTAAALLGGVLFSVALGLTVAGMTRSVPAGWLAVIVAYILPSGGWLSFLYADGWMLALWTAALGLALAFARSGTRWTLVAFAASLVGLLETKSANGDILVIAVVVVAVGAQLRGSAWRGPLRQLAFVGTVIAGFDLAIGWLVGAPGLMVTLQDYFTRHFSSPDVPDPLRLLLRRDASLLPRLLLGAWLSPLPLAAAAGLAALAWIRTGEAVVWLVAAGATLLTVVIHPAPSEVPRLLVPIWISVAVAAAAVAVRGWSWAHERGRPA